MRPWQWSLALTGMLSALWLVVVSFPAPGTGAFFSDTASVTTNTFASGTFQETPSECTGSSWKNAKVVRLSPGDSPYHAGNGKEIIFGTSGDDVIYGGNGKDCILGAGGDDFIEGGNGPDYIDGGPGTDTCDGDRSKDVVLNCEEGTAGDSAKDDKEDKPKHDTDSNSSGDESGPAASDSGSALAIANTPTATPSPTSTPTATPTPKTVNKPGEYKGILKFPSTPTPGGQ